MQVDIHMPDDDDDNYRNLPVSADVCKLDACNSGNHHSLDVRISSTLIICLYLLVQKVSTIFGWVHKQTLLEFSART